MLRKLSVVIPILNNSTRCSGKYFILDRFNHILDALIQVAEHSGANVTIDRSVPLRNRLVRYSKQIKEINEVIEELQKRGIFLDDFRLALDALIEEVEERKEDSLSSISNRSPVKHYIALDALISPSSVFELGVLEIQKNKEDAMTDAQRASCASLQMNSEGDKTPIGAISDDQPLPMIKNREKEAETRPRGLIAHELGFLSWLFR